MKAIIVSMIVFLFLSGCATNYRSKTTFVTDNEYVSQVEAVAQRRGVDVVWVNPPKQRVQRQEEKK